MSVSIQSLLQPVTKDQVRANFVTALQGLGVPAASWRAGGVASTILTVVAITYAGFWNAILSALQSLFLETASGTWLIYVAKFIYGVTAIPATFASGQVTLVNSGGGIYTYGAGQATFLNPATGVTYTNDAGFTLGALATLTIDVTATTLGTAGNADPGAISQLQTVMLGVTVSNASAVVGQDQESDAALRARCLAKLGASSVRGPRMAYEFYATTNTDGTPLTNSLGAVVNINRIAVSTNSSLGKVNVYLASPSGTPTTEDLTAATSSMETNARPEGVTLTVLGVTGIPYTTTMTVWCQASPGLAATDVQTAILDAIDDYLASYRIGGLTKPPSTQGYLYASGIEGVVKGAHSSIYAVDGITADLALVVGQVATNNILASNITVRLVSP